MFRDKYGAIWKIVRANRTDVYIRCLARPWQADARLTTRLLDGLQMTPV